MWDLLGRPLGKFNYKVKYSAPSTAHEDIVPSGWGEEFDKENGIIRIVQSPNLPVIVPAKKKMIRSSSNLIKFKHKPISRIYSWPLKSTAML